MLLSFAITSVLFTQATSFVGRQSNSIYSLTKYHHIQPIQVDDEFSKNVFDDYLEALDPGGYYFLASDVESLQSFSTTIDDEIKASTSSFFEKTIVLFKTRLLAVDSLLRSLEKEKFDFNKEEVLSFAEQDYPDYVQNYAELKERWRKWIKYISLDDLFTGNYFGNPLEETLSSLASKTNEAVAEAFDYCYYEIKGFVQHPAGIEAYMATYYLDAIATQFDPHTSYFSDIQRQDFVEDLSGENLVYGFSVEENENGQVVISSLIPGSPAWNCNELNKGDQVLSIHFADGLALNLDTADIDDMTLLFDNTKAKSLELEVRKVNGEENTIKLTKGKVYVEEEVIKNFILEGEKRVGYITLPDFYTDWDSKTALGCANDVAKTIVKLQKEQINGLILDLRNNGGGSMTEAIDLAGIFIDWGPLTITKERKVEPASIKDMNKGSIYNGPLVILVNGLSASASELLTAALQDYNRAIVVGSPTYGKATSQVILPLDPSYMYGITDPSKADPSFGYLKITTGQLYRITNSTHQRTGVIPHVVLPDIYDIYDYKESSYPNSLKPDSIVKKVYYTPFAAWPSQLFEENQTRINQLQHFVRINHVIDSLQKVWEQDDIIPLSLSKYLAEEIAFDRVLDELDSLEWNTESPYTVRNNLFDQEIINMDSYRRDLNEEYSKTVLEDVYLHEAYLVMLNYLKNQ